MAYPDDYKTALAPDRAPSRGEERARNAYADAEAARDTAMRLIRRVMEDAASRIEQGLDQDDIEYSAFHRKCARRNHTTPREEFITDLIDVAVNQAFDLPNPEDAAEAAKDANYWAREAE